MLRDFVIALSLANLWFFNVWRIFLITHPTSYPYYHFKANPAPIILATLLDVLMMAILMWFGLTLARRSGRSLPLKIARLLFLLISFVLLTNLLVFALIAIPFRRFAEALVAQLQLIFPSVRTATFYDGLWVLAGLLVVVLSTLLIHQIVHKRARLIKIIVVVLLVMSPFVLITFLQAGWQWARFKSGFYFQEMSAPVKPQQANNGKRILWIVFDELDFRISFPDRPPQLALPEFDRLGQESIVGTNAYPPSGDTILSIPALITGRLVSRSTRSAPNELMLTFADNPSPLPWSSQTSVFTRASEMGHNTALAGWYHPYCRIIGSTLTRCFRVGGLGFLNDQEMASSLLQSDVTLVKSMMRLAADTLVPSLVRIFTRTNSPDDLRKPSLESYRRIHQQAIEMAKDPQLDLIMVHYPIPHPPGIYDRSNHEFSLTQKSGYLDNLALADRTLGELRQQLEKQDLWETTTLLISSDHSLRADRVWRNHKLWNPRVTREDPAVMNSIRDERVPFILKIAGAGAGLNYEQPFNTVLSQALLLEILSGRISSGEEVARWLTQHRSIAESPYIDTEK